MLPNLKDAKETQLSKHVIVDESVKHHLSQQDTINDLSRSLDALKRQHEQLLAELQSCRQAGNMPQLNSGGLATRDLTAMSAAPHITSAAPQSHLAPSTDRANVPLLYDGAAGMQQRAASQANFVPSAFASSLGPLVPNPAETGPDAALEALGSSMPRSAMFEMPHTAADLHDEFHPSSTQPPLHEQHLQALFSHVGTNLGAEAGEDHYAHMYMPSQHYSDGTEDVAWMAAAQTPDLWRAQLASNGVGPFNHAMLAAHYSEMDANTMLMHTRSTPTVNI